MRLSELAARTGARFESSDGDIEITGAAGLEQAEPGQVTFLSNPRYATKVATTGASAIFVGDTVEVDRPDLVVLRAKDPYLAFTRALIAFHPRPEFEPGIHPTAVIDPKAGIGAGIFVGAHVFIGQHVTIGDRVYIYPNVTIYDNVTIGDDSEIQSEVAVCVGSVDC